MCMCDVCVCMCVFMRDVCVCVCVSALVQGMQAFYLFFLTGHDQGAGLCEKKRGYMVRREGRLEREDRKGME